MSGDQELDDFESWIQVNGERLLRFAYLVIGDRERAADAVQDALAAAYPRWERIVTSGDPSAYVRRSVINADTSRWRRYMRREQLVADVNGIFDLAASPNSDPAKKLPDEDEVWRCCRSLPTRQRAAVVLRYYEEYSDAEIAALLGCSVNTVRSQIHRAIAAMRRRLEHN